MPEPLHYLEMMNDGNIKMRICEKHDMTVEPPTAAVSSKKSTTPIVYHLRYTFLYEADADTAKGLIKDFAAHLKNFIWGNVWIGSVEAFKAGMQPTDLHIHFTFLSCFHKEQIRKPFLRGMEKWNHKVSGNRQYSLSVKPCNNIQVWRYNLKQQKNETLRGALCGAGFMEYMHKQFNVESFNQLRDEAYAVWLTACEVADAKDLHAARKSELQDRLFDYLDKLDNFDDLNLKVGIQKFYIEEEKKPFNKTTALGYFYNYKITKGHMTHLELASKW